MPLTHALARRAGGLPHATTSCKNCRPLHRLAAHAGANDDTAVTPAALPRRTALLGALATALAGATTSVLPLPAAADTTTILPSSSFIPDLPVAPLPRPYVDLTRRLIKDLRAAITTEVAGAEEFEVRRAAEPAKEAVKEWVGAYGRGRGGSGASASSSFITPVEGTASHTAIQAALKTLGSFYGSKGQRARLDEVTADAVLAALVAAEEGLPAPPPPGKGLKERLFGE